MPTKRIRVYELARELGLSNKEALDLCLGLGIGVKSHSSSLEDQQADRVRRKADREGLRREVQPDEDDRVVEPLPAEPKPTPTRVVRSQPASPTPPDRARPAPRPAPDPGAPPRPRPLADPGAPPRPRPLADPGAPARPSPHDAPLEAPAPSTVPGVPPRPAPPRAAPGVPPRGAPPRPAPPAGAAAPRQQPPGRLPQAPAARGDARPPTPAPAGGSRPVGRGAAPGEAPVPSDAGLPGGGARPTSAPRSQAGKPIPPPPGIRRPPTSMSGKPIPPPPGRGPAARPAPPAGGRGGGGPRTPGTTRPPGGFGSRTSGPPGGGFSRPGGPPRSGAPGGGAPGRGFGRGRTGRPPKRRRRRNIEELEAQEITRYIPKDLPVPEGEVIVERGSTAKDLGPRLNRSAADVVGFLLEQGEMITATQSLTDDMIELFAAELGATVRLVDPGEEQEAELQAKYFDDEEEDEADLRPRPPVVTVMGHVDHGKTLLLDRIREANVVAGEAGGITQHIGAYQVSYNDQLITFIDTPGHEAFTAMRARGAEVTDIVILVVAADDGVMPQTREALAHAKAADVPIIVAINKVDRDDADPNRVMQQLSELGLVPESWGGDTIMVEVSALQNLGVDDLLEQVLLVAELEELRANPEGRARGIVLEANLDAHQGAVATVIVQSGTLRVGEAVVAGSAWGRVKALIDDHGDNVKEAPPSFPALVLNFDTVPDAGDELRVTEKGRTARDIAEQREQRSRAASQRRTSSATGAGAKLEDIFEQIQRGERATLNLVLKADTQGSLEAVSDSLRKLERDEVRLAFVHRAVGGITANDVTLAAASNATIIGFNVRPDRGARDLAEAQDVEIRTYEIIYKLIEDIQSAMVGMLAPEYEEIVTGDAEVREIFRVPRLGAVAGCYVLNGVITRGSKVRFLRDGVIIWKGAITSLRRFKEDVREVSSGFECGIGLSNNQDLRQGDVIETFEEREIPRT